ncbi:TPA: hypothetical protein P0E19_005158, partial [Vibrio campbellii]|nr:hypothetical protein [Vibrio campbellii]
MQKKKLIGGILAIPILAILASYLAGYIYFFISDGDISQVTPLTFIEHWRYYHDNMLYQKSL